MTVTRGITIVRASLVVALTFALVAAASVSPAPARATLVGFDPGNIISDRVFFNSRSMTAAQIDAFLDARGAACVAGEMPCLKDYRQTTTDKVADTNCPGGYKGAANESAGQIIAKVAQGCGINPQVLLVTLQKEQGLITNTKPSASRYNKAMGFACPDSTGCDTKYYGFFTQVYKGAWQFQNYTHNPTRYGYRAGVHNQILYHPNTACGRKSVYIANQATANLYIYTPYTPNAASLAANFGTGNACSSYGNRNFYNYFTSWFGSTTGSWDVSAGSPFAADIEWLMTRGIATGYADGTFRPEAAVSRQAMAAFLYRAAGSPQFSAPAVSPFTDVPKDNPFYKEIAWLAASGISTGTDLGGGVFAFEPGDPVSRQAMAAFLYQAAGSLPFTDPAASAFADVPLDNPFYSQIAWLSAVGISTGTAVVGGKPEFRPAEPVSRQAMAAFLHRESKL